MMMAMSVHELATNAAKHGALSSATGQVSICWSFSEASLNVEWRERGGPTVAAPIHRGFGSQLLARALDQFGGSVETIFEPTGLLCKMSVTVLEETQKITHGTTPTEFRYLSVNTGDGAIAVKLPPRH
jgi:two-component sensor histidine kinase